MTEFTISISVPPDNPPISQVDQFGNEFAPGNQSSSERFIQILGQIKKQQYEEDLKQQELAKQKLQEGGEGGGAAMTTPGAIPFDVTQRLMKFTDHMNLARMEMEQLLSLVDMVRGEEKNVQLCSIERPVAAESNQITDVSKEVALKQKSLMRVSETLKMGGSRMKSTIQTMSKWWNDVSTLRSKWRLKGRDDQRGALQQPHLALVGKSNQKQKLSIDYGYYTSGSFQDQTEADLSRVINKSYNNNLDIGVYHQQQMKLLEQQASDEMEVDGASNSASSGDGINIEFPNLPYQNSITKRLYIDVKSSDSKIFNNHSSNKLKKSNVISLYKPEQQQQTQLSSINHCTKLLNQAQRYQFNYEIFEQLYKEATNSNTVSLSNTFSPLLPGQASASSNISSTVGPTSSSILSSQSSGSSLSASTIGGENIMITENEIRIECGNLNLIIGMESKANQHEEEGEEEEKPQSELTKEDQDRNRLLFLMKVVLKKISILQMKRSQRQLTMNLSRRNPKIVFGKKSIIPTDDVIIKLTSILKHVDSYLRVTKVFQILESKLPMKINSSPASTVSSSLFIIKLIDSAQNPKNLMVPIEVSIQKSKIDVVQGHSKSMSNKSEILMGIFIINQIQDYLLNSNPIYIEQLSPKTYTTNNLIKDIKNMKLGDSQKKMRFDHSSNPEASYFQSIVNEIYNL